MKEKQIEGNDTTRRMEQQPFLYWMTVITLVIIVIAFVIFPAIDGGFSSTSNNAVATFMGEKIPGDYYSLYAANLQGLNNYLEQEVASGRIEPQMVSLYYNFYKGQVLNQTAEVVAINRILKDRGIQKSASKIESLIRQNCGDPQLGITYRIDNSKAPSKANFSEKKYKEAASKNPLQVKAIRKNLALRDNGQFFYSDLASLSTTSKKATDFLNDAAKKRYNLSYLKIDEDMIEDSSLIPHIEKNLKDYTMLSLQVVRCDSKKTAKEIALEIKEDPELFSERAKQYQATGITNSEGEISGFASEIFSQLNVSKEATKSMLLALTESEISDITNVDGYFYIFKANADAKHYEAEFILNNHKEAIIDAIKENDSQEFNALLQESALALYNQAKESSLEAVAAYVNGEVQKVEQVAINYKNSNLLPQIDGNFIHENKTLLLELAKLNQSQLLAPVSYQEDLYIFRLDDFSEVSDNQISFNQEDLVSDSFRNWVLDPSRFVALPESN